MASPVQFPKQQEIIDESIEAPRDKFWRKIKEQPLIPIGSLLTCGALIAASHQLRKGNKEEFNRALRWRVGFQGLTVAAAVAGSLYYGAKAPLPPPPPPPASSIDPSSSTDHQSLSKSNYYTPAKVETLPGRPATNLQQSRAEEKKKEDSILLRRRIKEAEEKDRKEREMVERALMGESASASNRENLDSSSQTQDQNSSSGSFFRSWFGSGKGNNGQEQISEDSNKGPMRDSRGRPIIGQDSRRQ